MLTAICFIVILGLLIFVHELGHFVVARIAGMKVEEFAFGFPPRLLSKVKNGTRYSLNLVPLGGYVKILGEEHDSKDPAAFSQKHWFVRLLVVVAGVIMNFILAIILLSIGFKIGMVPPISDPAKIGGTHQPLIIISEIKSGSAAQQAGLIEGEIIRSADTNGDLVNFYNSKQIQQYTSKHKGEQVQLRLSNISGSKSHQIDVRLSNTDTPLGVALIDSAIIKLNWLDAIKQSIIEVGLAVKFIFKFLGVFISQLFRGHISQEVSGPVGIYKFTGQAVALGFGFVLQLAAMLSINLGLINILPFPALDGGRALFIVLEGVFRKKALKVKTENIIHTVGLFLLILFIVIVTFRDVWRLFH